MKRICAPMPIPSLRAFAFSTGTALLLAACTAGEGATGEAGARLVGGAEGSGSPESLVPRWEQEALSAVGRDADPHLLHQASELAKLGQTAVQIRETLRHMPTGETAPAPEARLRNGKRIPESEILRGHVDSGNNR